MESKKLSISLPTDMARSQIEERGQRLNAIRTSLDAAAADTVRNSAAEVSAHFDGLLVKAEKTPRS